MAATSRFSRSQVYFSLEVGPVLVVRLRLQRFKEPSRLRGTGRRELKLVEFGLRISGSFNRFDGNSVVTASGQSKFVLFQRIVDEASSDYDILFVQDH